ncbi:hypothetical protein [Nocardioides pakistanensis]
MLGPLPKFYRVIVSAVALTVFIGAGAWAAFMLPYPVLVGAGASVGLVVGAVITYLLVHAPEPAAEPRRVRRRHLH